MCTSGIIEKEMADFSVGFGEISTLPPHQWVYLSKLCISINKYGKEIYYVLLQSE